MPGEQNQYAVGEYSPPTHTMLTIAAYHGIKLEKTSSTDLSNPSQVRFNKLLTASQKVESSKATSKYNFLFKELIGQVQVELNNQKTTWDGSLALNVSSALLFQNPPIYSRSVDSEGNVAYEPLSSSQDASIPYLFFMLRFIEGKHARNLEPNFNITVKKSSKGNYNPLDVYQMFEYSIDNSITPVLIKGKVDPKVQKIFMENAKELMEIVKNVYAHGIEQCNDLKEVVPALQLATCFSESGRGPEQTLSILACLEVFHSVHVGKLCPELDLSSFNHEELMFKDEI